MGHMRDPAIEYHAVIATAALGVMSELR